MSDVTLASITLDSDDALRLAEFWGEFLGLPIEYQAEDGSAIALRGPGLFLSCVRVDGYQPPVWPGRDGASNQQVHLDLQVPDLDAGTERAIDLGARLATLQPQPDMWRVLLDPAGHPFCLMLPLGDEQPTDAPT